jgi:N-acetylmuramoyl-L-alanine amidase
LTLPTPTRALLLFACLAAAAQTTPPTPPKPKPKTRAAKPEAPAYNMNMVVLDPAHGGSDDGATLGENSLEKDANVAFAALLKPRLEARGFTVVLTHAAATDEVPTDARVELANRSRAVACLLLHASNGGHGVHLYTSALAPNHPSLTPESSSEILPWDTAQASVLPQSIRLSNDLAAAINGIRVPLVVGQASVKPIDSLSCPAVMLELSPLAGAPASDAGYQARIADSVAQALVFWRGHVISISAAAAAVREMSTPTPPAEPARPALRPKPKPVPPPVKIPQEEPLVDTPAPLRTAPPKPAPIVRPTPDAPPPPQQGASR